MKYNDVYYKVFQLIDQEPSKRWDLKEMSRRLGYSPYHFHRIFKQVSGETFQHFLNNRRLSYSAMELISTSNRIIDIALDYEFSSHETYSRAFKRNFHISPTSFRENSATFAFFEQNFMLSPRKGKQLPKIEYISEFNHVGIRAKEENPVGKEWVEFIKKGFMKSQQELIGVIYLDPYQYVPGVKADGIVNKDRYEKREISSSWYITVNHFGTYNTIRNSYQYLHDIFLPTTSFTNKKGPELEIYQKYKPVKICIPIERRDE